MGKCIAYTVGAVTFMGLGALVTGLSLYFVYPNMRANTPSVPVDDELRVAKCHLVSTDGNSVSGTITFAQDGQGNQTFITGSVRGLSAGLHGFHIHEFGGTGNACKDAGGHYNPNNQLHGGPDSSIRHVGDLGNIQSVAESGSTVAPVEISDKQVTLFGELSVLGRSVVVHIGEDDLGASGDASGAAGARVACCPIYIIPSTV